MSRAAEALRISRALGYRSGAWCARAAGGAAQAEALRRQALEIFQRIGAAEARDPR